MFKEDKKQFYRHMGARTIKTTHIWKKLSFTGSHYAVKKSAAQ